MKILCSTGALVGRPNGRDFRLFQRYVPMLDCDGIEFILYDSWYPETEAITEVGPYRKTDAKPDQRTFHGPREKTTAVWYTQNGERRVLCLCASDALKEKLTEAAHAGK